MAVDQSPMNKLITEHIDIWTSAVKTRSTSGRGSSKKLELYGVKKLRELILELAVRGKLVPQDPSDEPASVLLERIAEEKKRLVKDKLIPRTKGLPPINEDEIPIDLPNGWTVVRLGELTSKLGSGSTPRGGKNAYTSEGIPFLRSQNVRNEGIKLDDIAYISEEIHQKMENTKVLPGDVLLNITGASLGRSTIFPSNLVEANVSQHVTIIRLIESQMNQFIHLGILSPLVQQLVWGRQVGMAIEGLSKKVLEMFEFPIPPIAEQHRIVAKVDELMALCDQLEQQTETSIEAHQVLVTTLLDTLTNSADADELIQNWARISEHFDTLFTTEESIDQLKQTILQLAVMGKLVPQDPSDEPAAELLKRIAEEKAQLVKEKKIKKQKALPPIAEDEKPFELPSGWEWCKFGELSQFINGDRGKNYPNKNEYVSDGIPWINTGHIQPDGTLTTSDMNFITEEKFDSLRSGKIIPDDLVYCLRGATFGKTAFVKPYVHGAIASSLMIIRLFDNKMNGFVYRYLTSAFGRSQIFRFDNGSAQPNLSANSVGLYAFPCPPLEEQKRIVAKINELFEVCEQLQARIADAKSILLDLTDAIVEQAM
ncbi:restriction endonuclease subunit S [Vibrio alginolyticus]|uniref:restriction endonuclease subunit S n=1 Tax=Vibrio alginolyticus TaxID=663 RepID=UPI001BD42F56|nr:restriction endonuclease subunit S [Vibrio alginolyticus]MBT0094065.1 restriction endonuclease subunit S [Vibrio alginolyticus]